MVQPRQADVRNRLLASLDSDSYARMAPSLEFVSLTLRDILIAAEQPITHLYFIESGLVSLVADTETGRIEIGLVGREGAVGTPLVLGADRTPHMAIVQGEGAAWRIAAGEVRAALDASASARTILGRYVQSLIVQVGRTVYANAELNVEGRLARWILMTRDRLDEDEMPFTHEFLSMMLAVRRPGITTAVHMLEGAGMIRARRGRIMVLDREKLQEMAGDAYGPAEAEYERLLGAAGDHRTHG